jgi:radical SAM protein with 4Fe4S-binding SPASM domain
MCDIWKREQSREVTAVDLERHRESLRALAVEWVVLTGGEPLMNRDLPALCTFFRELGIRVTLLTTGLLLERRAAEVAICFDDIIVSLDGPAETHDAIRCVKGGFDLIGRGVTAVRRLHPGMRISARSTVQKLNHALLRQTAQSAKDLGLNSISFLAADVSSEAFNRPLGWPNERQSAIALSPEETDALQREVEALIEWRSTHDNVGYVAESPAKLLNLVRQFRAYLRQACFESPRCNAPWVSVVVEADGTVRPCFFHQAVGSIRNQNLEDVVNGEAARNFRRNLSVPNNSICQRCVCSLYHDGPIRG